MSKHRWRIEWTVTDYDTGRELYYAMDTVPKLTEEEAYEHAQKYMKILVERSREDWPQTKTALVWTALGSDPHLVQMSGRRVSTPDR
jgi:hypothetical protein